MSNMKLSLALFAVMLLIDLGTSVVVATSPPPCTSATIYAVPGDLITLAAPTPPSGVAYTYLWTIQDANSYQFPTASTQTTVFTIPTSTSTPPVTGYYIATLSVGSGTSGSGQLTGCVLQSCLNISVQLTNTCGITGGNSVCQTNTTAKYTYTGNAAISGAHPTAYLLWKVDTTTVTPNDATGYQIVNWPTFWTSGVNQAQTHTVTVEVHSKKTNGLLNTCSYTVTVLPTPVTTITPT